MSATGGSTAPMYASMFVNGLSAIGTGISQSGAIRATGNYEESVANTNAKLSELKAKQSLSAGDAEVSRREEESRLQVGAARAAGGASGAQIGVGSSARVIHSIEDVGKVDELTIKNNAARTAWGFQTQAMMDRFRGKMAKLTAKAQSQQTLITGGLKAISGPMSIYGDYTKYSQRYSGRQATPGIDPYAGEVMV